jgi:alcohol dehydrogenase
MAHKLNTSESPMPTPPIRSGADEAALVMLSDIFPTGLECGVLSGKVEPGSTVVIVGAG